MLDDCVEYLRGRCSVLQASRVALTALPDPADPQRITENTRPLGLVVCRGPQITLMSPSDGMEEIANPFGEDAAEDEIVVQDR